VKLLLNVKLPEVVVYWGLIFNPVSSVYLSQREIRKAWQIELASQYRAPLSKISEPDQQVYGG